MNSTHSARRPSRLLLAAGVISLAVSAGGPPLTAQPASSAAAGGPAVRVVMMDLAFYGKRANSLEPGDSLLAHEGTAKVRDFFVQSGSVTLLDSATVAGAMTSPEALEAAAGKPCNVIVACAREVGRRLGVPWVVMGKVSKTSNLIWIFSGQLIDVATGRLVMDDEYELKGNAHDMVAAGARVFARRVVKKMGPQPGA